MVGKKSTISNWRWQCICCNSKNFHGSAVHRFEWRPIWHNARSGNQNYINTPSIGQQNFDWFIRWSSKTRLQNINWFHEGSINKSTYAWFENHIVRIPKASSDCCHERHSRVTYIQSLKNFTSSELVPSSCVRQHTYEVPAQRVLPSGNLNHILQSYLEGYFFILNYKLNLLKTRNLVVKMH